MKGKPIDIKTGQPVAPEAASAAMVMPIGEEQLNNPYIC